MTVRFLALYERPADPEAFERHYREVHIPLARRLPGLRRYTVGRDLAPVRGGEPYYLVASLEWDSLDDLRAAFASPEASATVADAAHLQQLAPVRSMIVTLEEDVLWTPRPAPSDRHAEETCDMPRDFDRDMSAECRVMPAYTRSIKMCATSSCRVCPVERGSQGEQRIDDAARLPDRPGARLPPRSGRRVHGGAVAGPGRRVGARRAADRARQGHGCGGRAAA
ncbi:EthD family reductase [Streptomyces sp. NPDC058755]|uniref:EthD family reductase n=1 Tax=Streptomyces sp. NPDC058755 TaxID=3346624 RepID=UPI0036CB2034